MNDLRIRFGKRKVWVNSFRCMTRIPHFWIEQTYPKWAGAREIRFYKFRIVLPCFGDDQFVYEQGIIYRFKCAIAAWKIGIE